MRTKGKNDKAGVYKRSTKICRINYIYSEFDTKILT